VGAGATGDFSLFCRGKDECALRLDNVPMGRRRRKLDITQCKVLRETSRAVADLSGISVESLLRVS
jgi:hypothetical protein